MEVSDDFVQGEGNLTEDFAAMCSCTGADDNPH